MNRLNKKSESTHELHRKLYVPKYCTHTHIRSKKCGRIRNNKFEFKREAHIKETHFVKIQI